MVAVLRRRSQEFAALWDTHDVAIRRVDHKRIVHPALGVIELDCHNLLSEDGRQRLLWFTAPPGTGVPRSWSCCPSSARRSWVSPEARATGRLSRGSPRRARPWVRLRRAVGRLEEARRISTSGVKLITGQLDTVAQPRKAVRRRITVPCVPSQAGIVAVESSRGKSSSVAVPGLPVASPVEQKMTPRIHAGSLLSTSAAATNPGADTARRPAAMTREVRISRRPYRTTAPSSDGPLAKLPPALMPPLYGRTARAAAGAENAGHCYGFDPPGHSG